MIRFILLPALVLLAMSLQAKAIDPPAPGSLGAFNLQGEKQAQSEYAIESGQLATFEIPVDAPLGSAISFRPEFFQLSSDLGAPMSLPMDYKTPILTFTNSTRIVVPFSFRQEVKRPTTFLFRLSTVDHKDPQHPRPLQNASVRIIVYPKEKSGEIAKSLAQKQKESGLTLTVFGESPVLRQFLSSRRIDFRDAGTEWPSDMKADSLYIAQSTAKKFAEHVRQPFHSRVIIFLTDFDLLPGIYRTETSTGIVTKVSLSFVDNLETNPRSRQQFLELLYQNLTRPTENP